ncbi:MAG TPA: preprotein translocase subunit SecY [Fimbriimonadaceae bacterium]|nr:preprotein translocase subunit SecY [Fimbriimonadaceae bacterium]
MFGGDFGPTGTRGDKSLSMGLLETFRAAWADPDLRARLLFVFYMFAVYVFGVHVPVPIPGVSASTVADLIQKNQGLQLISMFGGGAIRRVSIFALGLGPYITAAIIMQILAQAMPNWKKEMQEGGEYARQQQNKRTRGLTLFLCIFQGSGLFALLKQGLGPVVQHSMFVTACVVLIWTAGAMFALWLGEQISEKGIGNGVSLMIFAGIVLSLPYQFGSMYKAVLQHQIYIWQPLIMILILIGTTWLIIYFTVAQRRLPIQHMRRMIGTKAQGGQTSYLPFSVNMVGVIPLIFAMSLLWIPSQIQMFFASSAPRIAQFFQNVQTWVAPSSTPVYFGHTMMFNPVGVLIFTAMVFFFTYFYTAIQFNVEDIADNLKRGGSFIPGVRPGKQTKDFLDAVISRITFVGSMFLAVVALVQYLAPTFVGIPFQYVSYMGGTSLLIIVAVALETLRQVEANLLMKKYGQ